jgi:hypothetical protein
MLLALILGFAGVAGAGPSDVLISVLVDSEEQAGDFIIPPGTHAIHVNLTNQGTEALPAGTLSVSVRRLHAGLVWNTSATTPPLAPARSHGLTLSVPTELPGLHTVMVEYGSGTWVAGADRDLHVSFTSDRWQQWRTGNEVPNETRLFLAFYYPWYGTPDGPAGNWLHWTPQRGYDSTHVPLIGFYDSRSEEVISYHVRTAKSVGLDGFISSWWGPDNYIDDAFPMLLKAAEEFGLKATIYLEIAQSPQDLADQLHYVLTRYGDHPAFLSWDGRPVIFIYGRVMGDLELGEFAQVFSELETQGLPAFYLADRLDVNYLQVFDGLHTYSPLSNMDKYHELTDECDALGKVFAATIAPGYDDTIIRDPGLVVDRDNGSFYQDSWETIMLSQPDWVLITSWNEWHEGSEIEPSLEFGDLYLNLTQEYYDLFESGEVTPRLEARIAEIDSMLSTAEDLIEAALAKGMDTRLLSRDLMIAENAWEEFDYGTTKMWVGPGQRGEVP